jgi:hypothetical protein
MPITETPSTSEVPSSELCVNDSDLEGDEPAADDCSETPQQSNSDLNIRIDPETGRMIDEWYE